MGNAGHDRVFERVGAAMRAALELLARQLAEPTFDHVDPRGTRWGEVHVEVGTFRQPAPNGRCLVRAVVVEDHEDQVNIEIGGHAVVDQIQELSEPLRPMPRFTAPDDLAGLRIQRREERHRAMAHVVVRTAPDLPGPHRQQRLRPAQGLDLRLLIHAQHVERVRGRGRAGPGAIRQYRAASQ